MLLKAVGPNLGVTEPAEMFWATGALSSFLDNTPTYLVFLTTAGTLAFYKWNHNHTGNSTYQDSVCHFLWCGIHGREHLYRKCTELYGQVHF